MSKDDKDKLEQLGTWNYRVFKAVHAGVEEFSIREVYYDKAGNVSGYTKSAVDPYGQSIQELRDDLHKMLEATDKGVLS